MTEQARPPADWRRAHPSVLVRGDKVLTVAGVDADPVERTVRRVQPITRVWLEPEPGQPDYLDYGIGDGKPLVSLDPAVVRPGFAVAAGAPLSGDELDASYDMAAEREARNHG